jgi:hypothetical protein
MLRHLGAQVTRLCQAYPRAHPREAENRLSGAGRTRSRVQWGRVDLDPLVRRLEYWLDRDGAHLSFLARKGDIEIAREQSRKQLSEAPRCTVLCAIKPQHDIESASVPFARKVWQLLILGEFWKNSVDDPLVLPADQNGTRQLSDLINQRHFVSDAILGDRADMQSVADWDHGFKRALAL